MAGAASRCRCRLRRTRTRLTLTTVGTRTRAGVSAQPCTELNGSWSGQSLGRDPKELLAFTCAVELTVATVIAAGALSRRGSLGGRTARRSAPSSYPRDVRFTG